MERGESRTDEGIRRLSGRAAKNDNARVKPWDRSLNCADMPSKGTILIITAQRAKKKRKFG